MGTTRMPADGAMNDCPASYHGGAGALSFADGHSEIHKWQDLGTLRRTAQPLADWLPSPRDYVWLAERTTGPK
jgi:prepilin-type processing-associated H-X9-DG protein